MRVITPRTLENEEKEKIWGKKLRKICECLRENWRKFEKMVKICEKIGKIL